MADKPSIWYRLKLAWHVFQDGLPWRPWSRRPPAAKRSPLIWPTWRDGKAQWQLEDFGSYVEEGFNLNSLIYDAIMYKARATTVAPLRLYRGDPENPERVEPTHPIAQLLERPNTYQSWTEFAQMNEVYLNLAGNVYIHLDRPRRGMLPTAMRSLRPDRVRIIPENRTLKGFLYVPEGRSVEDGVPILPEDMIHIKLPNPLDPLEGVGFGLSPLAPAAMSGDVDNDITRFLKVFFEHGGMPPIALTFEHEIDEEEVHEARARWRQVYGGVDNWGDIAVLGSNAKIQQAGMTFEQMGFASIDERNESRIVGPFGVPLILLNTRTGLERSTFENFEQARRQFWQDTFIPEHTLFESEFRYYLNAGDGTFVAYDYSRVPALQQDVPKLVDAAHKLWSMGIPANLALRTVGLDVEPVPGGDTAYVPINVVPAGQPRDEGDGDAIDGNGASATDDQRRAVIRPLARTA